MRAIFFSLLLAFSSYNHADSPCHSVAELNWLQGQWQAVSGKNTQQETWLAINPTTYQGEGITRDPDGSVSFQESLHLVTMQGEVFYLAKVKSNPLPVAFRGVQCDGQSATFENKDHDFPNRLTYQYKKGQLLVEVTNNQGKGFKLTFSRLD